MKKTQVNRNFIWAETFVNQLYALGVRNVCISPGSRSTPLTLAFTKNKKIKSFVNIDERVSGFFALGIAKAIEQSIVIITTSGTATAELYPAIVEAYMSRVPLIICTADRPPELLNRGANQTINQWNLYRNHIRFFKNVGSPRLTIGGLNRLKKIASKAFEICSEKNRGPVHLNFPFRKPLEPNSYTDEVDEEIISCVRNPKLPKERTNESDVITKSFSRLVNKFADKIEQYEKGLIIVGPSGFDGSEFSEIIRLARISGYPVMADGLSPFRFQNLKSSRNVCVNYDSYLRSYIFTSRIKPDIIFYFGRTVTSTFLQDYLANSGAEWFIINKYGDVFDPDRKSKAPIKSDAKDFCNALNQKLLSAGFNRKNTEWKKSFTIAEKKSSNLKDALLDNAKLRFEAKVVNECISSLPSNTKVMVGNSLPVRDLDNFVSPLPKNIKIYFNRGASGIDGVTSTALGIAIKQNPVLLITGDLSFLHDLNALMPAAKYSIPLVIVLINNNGGGIFNSLPLSSNDNVFKEYFITPHNLDISKIVSSFGVKHHQIKNEKDLNNKILSSLSKNYSTVLEVKTNSILSKKERQKYWTSIVKQIDKEFEGYEI